MDDKIFLKIHHCFAHQRLEIIDIRNDTLRYVVPFKDIPTPEDEVRVLQEIGLLATGEEDNVEDTVEGQAESVDTGLRKHS